VPELNALLRARSVAIVGASPHPDRFGWHVLRQLIDFRYPGRIVPVNPAYPEIEGLRCYPRLSEIHEPVDCAAICLSDERLEAALEEVAAAGIPAAVIFGVAEGCSRTGGRLDQRLGEIAREADIALMGANCMGFFNFADRLFLTGYPYHREPRASGIAFITHSGSTLSAIAKNTRGMDFNYVISAGKELALTAAVYLAFVLEQPETTVVGLFLETIRDPERFLAALAIAEAKDLPVVLLKVGRSERGAEMAVAHTGAIAGAQAAIGAVCRRHGVTQVRTIEEMLDAVELFASGRKPPTGKLSAITDSGGERAMVVDLATDVGVEFADLSEATVKVLAENLDPGLAPVNPADLWSSGKDWQRRYRACIAAMLADDATGAFDFGIDFNIGSRLGPDYGDIAIEAFHSTTKPFAVVANVHDGLNPEDANRLRAAGVPVLQGAETGLLAFRHLFNRACRILAPVPSAIEWNPDDDMLGMFQSGATLTEAESMRLLGAMGLNGVPYGVARSEREAVSAATKFGFPVVVKTAMRGVAHKSDAGGVRLGLRAKSDVRAAYGDMRAAFGPDVIVQPHLDTARGIELFLGMTFDEQFGPLVTVGLGGIWIELWRDSVTFLAPCSATEVAAGLRRLRNYPILAGARGRDPVDTEALANLVSKFSCRAAGIAPWVREIDVNPLFASGGSFTMLDALVVPRARLTE
jgi:acyl-CoA synthetase (NDP forming)